jgi:hypothetical protein
MGKVEIKNEVDVLGYCHLDGTNCTLRQEDNSQVGGRGMVSSYQHQRRLVTAAQAATAQQSNCSDRPGTDRVARGHGGDPNEGANSLPIDALALSLRTGF